MTQPPITGTVGYMLARVSKLHRQRAEELLTEIGLHVGQEMLLAALQDSDGITQSKLAESLMNQPSTVTNMLQRMERAGLVVRSGDSKDRRVTRVIVTEKGHRLNEAAREQWGLLEDESFKGFSIEERILLRRLLFQAYQNLAGKV